MLLCFAAVFYWFASIFLLCCYWSSCTPMHRQSDMLLTLGGGRLLRCLPQRLESMVMPSVILWPLTSLLARSSRILSLPPTIVMWAVQNHMYILFVVCYCALQRTSLVLQHMHFWTFTWTGFSCPCSHRCQRWYALITSSLTSPRMDL